MYLLAVVVIIGMAVFVARQDKRAAQECAKNSSDHAKTAVAAKTDEKISKDNVEESERNSPSWFGIFRWPNGTATLALILTLLAVAEQAKETAKSTKAAQESAQGALAAANAALLNAQAFINAERPWILVKAELAKRPESGTWYDVVAVNKGRTPAEVISHTENRTVIGQRPHPSQKRA